MPALLCVYALVQDNMRAGGRVAHDSAAFIGGGGGDRRGDSSAHIGSFAKGKLGRESERERERDTHY